MLSELSQHEGRTDMSANDLNNTSQTNWEALESMSDEDIDYSDIPPLSVSVASWKRLGQIAASKIQLLRRSNGLIIAC